ncbi:MAG: hypothetical protein AB7Q01_08465 [Gammaproteobacteria bacterium]
MSNKAWKSLLDADGERWAVLPSDPAHALLDRLPWETPRLPASVLRTGAVTENDLSAAVRYLETAIETVDGDPDFDALILDLFDTERQLRYLAQS